MALDTGVLKQRQEETEKRRKESAGKEFFNLADGKNSIRILPRSMKYFGPDKDDDFAVRYYVHYNMFEADGYKMIVCNKTTGHGCPLCDEISRLNDKTLSSRIRAKERFMYNVLDMSDSKIKLLETGPKIYDEILKFVLNPEWGDLFGLDNGRNVTIEKIPAEKSGTGWVEYSVMPSPMISDVTPALLEGWEAEVDRLVEKIPEIRTLEEFQRVANCFATGASPIGAPSRTPEPA